MKMKILFKMHATIVYLVPRFIVPPGKHFLRTLSTNSSCFKNKIVTVQETRIEHFEKLKNDWWDPNGIFRILVTVNEVRVPFIKEVMQQKFSKHGIKLNENVPFENLNILDVGCGGGLLSEPLARLGGNVTGIDPSKELIEVAKTHAERDKNLTTLNYLQQNLEDHVANNTEKYDMVVLAQVLPHVLNWKYFVDCAIKCLKPGGSLIIITINKTLSARFLLAFLYEDVLKIAPKGNFQYKQFTPMNELKKLLRTHNLKIMQSTGYGYRILSGTWYLKSSEKIRSMIHAIKN